MLYPLKFKPYLKFYPYGGRRFVEVLEKQDVPRDRDVAETWEVSDHGEEQSVVVNGELTGKTLRELMQEFRAAVEQEGLEVDSTDGIKVTLPSGWVHVRASSTESMIRIIVESSEKSEAQELLDWARDRIRR